MPLNDSKPLDLATQIHDIKNHVSVISLYVELLKGRLQDQAIDAKTMDYVSTIERRTKELEESIEILTTIKP